MTTRYDGRDRAKASEHSILMWHELHVTSGQIPGVLPRVAERLAGKLSLTVPVAGGWRTLPLDLVLAPSGEPSDWWIELQLSLQDGIADFFEGDICFEKHVPQGVQSMLRGRFAFPQTDPANQLDADAMHEVAEDNVTRIFEQISIEIESVLATNASFVRKCSKEVSP